MYWKFVIRNRKKMNRTTEKNFSARNNSKLKR